MVQTEQEKLAFFRTAFEEILFDERNSDSWMAINEIIKDLKVKDCLIKYGWTAGKEVDITCMFNLHGKISAMDSFFKSIEKEKELHYFIYGLDPEILHFNPMMKVIDNDIIIISFKLKKNG